MAATAAATALTVLRESPAVVSGERANSREEQANYFYVVWPEETVTTLSAQREQAGSICSSPVHRSAAGLHRHSHPLQNHRITDTASINCCDTDLGWNTRA